MNDENKPANRTAARMAGLCLVVMACLFGAVPAGAAFGSPDRGSFGPFMRSLNDTLHGYRVVRDPTGTAPTPLVERFEVRPGDCGANAGWNDCEKDRERSELSERKKDTAAGTTHWYGWSFYVPGDYVNVYPTKVALGQFHQKGAPVIWMFQNGDGGYSLDDHVSGSARKKYPLIDEKNLRGRWHRIEVQARWSTADDGFFRVWVNGGAKVDYRGPTMSAAAVYFKYGVYRSFVSRYQKAAGVRVVPAQTVYFANVRRADARTGLQP